jgi:hypothetical protein
MKRLPSPFTNEVLSQGTAYNNEINLFPLTTLHVKDDEIVLTKEWYKIITESSK